MEIKVIIELLPSSIIFPALTLILEKTSLGNIHSVAANIGRYIFLSSPLIFFVSYLLFFTLILILNDPSLPKTSLGSTSLLLNSYFISILKGSSFSLLPS